MPECAVGGCGKQADVEVILYDFYSTGDVFFEQDFTCPYLCTEHLLENEAEAFSEIGRSELGVTLRQIADRYEAGERRMGMAISHCVDRPLVQALDEIGEDWLGGAKIPPLRNHRGGPRYPYTNKNHAQGFTIYRPLHR
jgi:hypothetical protein